MRQGEYSLAQALLEEATLIIKKTGDQKLLARSLLYLGIVLFGQGHYNEANEILEECLQKGRAAGSKYYLTAPLNNLGFVAIARQDYAAARRYLEEAIAIERTVKSRSSILANALGNMAHIACIEGDYSGARALGEEALLIRQELGDKWGIAYSLGRFGVLAATIGMPERAARLWGAAEALRESIGTPLVPAELEIQQRGIELAHDQLDEAAFAAAYADGRKLPLKKAITFALSA
jgi:tetratricopeptide (TPR) repeat protein